MEIVYADSYTKNGCYCRGKLGIIEYSKFDERRGEFNSAHRSGGLFDQLGKAKALMQERHPKTVAILSIPDLVFRIVD